MTMRKAKNCPECSEGLDRRTFVQATAAAGAGAMLGLGRLASAAPTAKSKAETIVHEFYGSLSDAQKKDICFPFDHPKRKRISANWKITDHDIADSFYTDAQRDLIKRVLQSITSEDGFERIVRQMDEDDGGWENYSVAVFGQPGSGKFQFELTGRHATMRADGDSVNNYAFGGPVVYGHGESVPADNLFHYQTKQANEVFSALNDDQRSQALLDKAPQESAVPIQGEQGSFPGVQVGTMSSDQKELVEKAVKIMLAPYRQEDVDEVVEILKATGGLDKLHMAFYKEGDLEKDQVWDIWRMEGPGFVWHFRGAPHVHTYVNIGIKS